MTIPPPWLTEAEVDDLCAPLTQHAAQIRYLTKLGLTVKTKPNGAPLVIRAHFDEILGRKPRPIGKRGPDRAGLLASFKRAA